MMRTVRSFIFAITFLVSGCEDPKSPTETTVSVMRPVNMVEFSMIKFEYGGLTAFNPSVHRASLGTRYGETVANSVSRFVAERGPSCGIVGFSAVIKGDLAEVGRKRTLMLNIEEISDLRPLSESKRRELTDRSPTLNRARIC